MGVGGRFCLSALLEPGLPRKGLASSMLYTCDDFGGVLLFGFLSTCQDCLEERGLGGSKISTMLICEGLFHFD